MIQVEGNHFKDEHGRTLMLRGVNLGGSSKVPFRPNGATYMREGFFDHRGVSFIGRPFPLEEADEHFARLKVWGLTFLRFLVTWEAIEHAGPGIYDETYLDYIRAVAQKAGHYGISLFIDPHQDVWSRFSGGDGAPGWTLEAAGFDMTQFAETGAAIVHATHGDPFPKMIWPSNNIKLATATMFTLFFAGNDFAPQTKVDGEPVQEFLQRHYIAAIQQVAGRLRDLENVVGYDTMNEPLGGYIGHADLNKAGLSFGLLPTPFQSMLLGAGFSQDVPFWELKTVSIKQTGTHKVNPDGRRAWLEGHECIWKQNGVWDLDTNGSPRLLQPNYFAQVDGRSVDFVQDYYLPFAKRYTTAIREIRPEAIIFVETESSKAPPHWEDAGNAVYAPHWYDGMVVAKKRYNPFIAVNLLTLKPVFGAGRIRKSFAAQMAKFRQYARENLGEVPVLIGEFGIPFDMDGKRAFRNGDFRQQVKALDRSFQAIEANLLHCTLWNYTADNSNERGDMWNDEDFSIFSRDQQIEPEEIHSGGRALEAALRPYARATAGEPLHMSFVIRKRRFEFTFRHNPAIIAATEIYVPTYQYPRGYHVEVTDGTYEIKPEEQVLIYRHGVDRTEHTLVFRPA